MAANQTGAGYTRVILRWDVVQPGAVASPPGTVCAKALLEGVRVPYMPPEFQARPYTPVTVSGGLITDQPATSSPSTTGGTVREGVIVLAASTKPISITYQTIAATVPISDVVGRDSTCSSRFHPAAACVSRRPRAC